MNRRIKASVISIGADGFLIGVKIILAFLSGSAALLADAYHSLSDLFVSLAVLLGASARTWLEKREERKAAEAGTQVLPEDMDENEPPSEESPAKAGPEGKIFPERKPGYWIEAAIAYVISLVILYIPYVIISGVRENKNNDLKYAWVAVLGVIICIVIAYFLSRYKLIMGREVESPALVADGYHSRMDMFTSLAVLASLMGQMIGIRLDPLVAVVIAVMIGMIGLELFVTSIIGFINGSPLRRQSLFTWLNKQAEVGFAYLAMKLLGRDLGLADLRLAERLSLRRWYSHRRLAVLLGLVLIVYAGSGVTMIRLGETGVRLFCGRIVATDLSSGLTWSYPWPLGEVKRVRLQDIQRVELGFRTDSKIVGSISPSLWESSHVVKGYRKVKKESISLSGDENIIDISLVLHYRLTDPVTALFRVNGIKRVLNGLLEASVRQVLATQKADQLLVENRKGVLESIAVLVREKQAALGLGVEILDVFCHDLHPPVEVVDAFRDVFSARESRAQMLNEAETYRNTSLPQARSDSLQKLLDATADATERRERATGDAGRFALTSAAARRNPDVTHYRLFIEMAERGLQGKRKIIADPAVNRGGYKLWLFAPEKGGFPFGMKNAEGAVK